MEDQHLAQTDIYTKFEILSERLALAYRELEEATQAAAPFIERLERAKRAYAPFDEEHHRLRIEIKQKEEADALKLFAEEFPRQFTGTVEEFESQFHFDGWEAVTTNALVVYAHGYKPGYFERMSTLTPRQIKYLCYKISGQIDFDPSATYIPEGHWVTKRSMSGYMDFIEYLEEQSCAYCGVISHDITKCPTAPLKPVDLLRIDVDALERLTVGKLICMAHVITGERHPYPFFWFSRGDGCLYRHRQEQSADLTKRVLSRIIADKVYAAKRAAKKAAAQSRSIHPRPK